MTRRKQLSLATVFLLALSSAPAQAPRKEVIEAAERLVTRRIAEQQLPAAGVVLVEGNRVVWSRGFGAMTAETLVRTGSLAKVLTSIAVMQQVEQGKLNLDLPIGRYLGDFRPGNPSGKPITLRHLLAQRSGLVREPPVGNSFDRANPSLEQAVASLNETELVFEPGQYRKDSNAAMAVAGLVLERTGRAPFAQLMQDRLLRPLVMNDSAFEPDPRLEGAIPKALLWTYDGRTFPAPAFAPAISPAVGFDSNLLELGDLLKMLIGGGQGPQGLVIRKETLELMAQPQFGDRTQGLGFAIGEIGGQRVLGQSGSIAGFSSQLEYLPDAGIGVAVVATKDGTVATVADIAHRTLEWMLDARAGKPLRPDVETRPVPAAVGRSLEGIYARQAGGIEVEYKGDRLWATPLGAGTRVDVRQTAAGDLLTDGPLSVGRRLNLIPAERSAAAKPAPVPARWLGLMGEYGDDWDTVTVLERGGKLTALIEWFYYHPLVEVNSNSFRAPGGRYAGEEFVFTRDSKGRATHLTIGGVRYARRPDPAQPGSTFRIQPVRPVEELRKEAARAVPPAQKPGLHEPDLVDVTSIEPGIKLDIRYAGIQNFLATPIYTVARAAMQRPAAEALARAHRALAAQGYGLMVHDAYRPWAVTWIFWEATPPEKHQFVADPHDGSRHNRGCAVDLTLYDLKTGKAVEMPSQYDEMSTRAYPDFPGGGSLERWQREILRHAMEAEGFTVFDYEWWHFDYKSWPDYPALNVPLEAIK